MKKTKKRKKQTKKKRAVTKTKRKPLTQDEIRRRLRQLETLKKPQAYVKPQLRRRRNG